MKTTIVWGKIRKETPKAINIDGQWVGRGAIESLQPIACFYDRDGDYDKDSGNVAAILKFPIDVSGDSSQAVGIRLVDGRRFWKQGFLGWHLDSEQSCSVCEQLLSINQFALKGDGTRGRTCRHCQAEEV